MGQLKVSSLSLCSLFSFSYLVASHPLLLNTQPRKKKEKERKEKSLFTGTSFHPCIIFVPSSFNLLSSLSSYHIHTNAPLTRS